MSGMGSALPTNGHAREDSYGSTGSGAEADLPVDNEEAFEGHDEENEALKKYKGGSSLLVFPSSFVSKNLSLLTLPRFPPRTEQMHSYIASRFASFKTDLEQKTRAEGTSMPPTGLPKRRN